jgi:hypothetical protein
MNSASRLYFLTCCAGALSRFLPHPGAFDELANASRPGVGQIVDDRPPFCKGHPPLPENPSDLPASENLLRRLATAHSVAHEIGERGAGQDRKRQWSNDVDGG